MKRLSHLIILLGISLTGFSQIEQGTLSLGGSIYGNGYSEKTEDNDPNKSISLGLSPSIGFFIIDNFELRISPRFSFRKNSYNSSYEYISNSAAFGIDAIKYFGSAPLKPFVGLGFQSGLDWTETEIKYFEYINNEEYSTKSSSKIFENQGSVNIGLAYFLNQYINIKTSIEYTHSIFNRTIEQEGDDPNDQKGKRDGIYFNIGFGIFF